MAEPTTKAYLLPDSDQLVQVPPDRISEVESAGYRQASPEQERDYYIKKEQRAKGGLQQTAEGLAVGAASGALAIPAIAASVTGIDEGATGHEYLAELINNGEVPPDEMLARVRAVAEAAPVAHFAGELIPTMATGGAANAAAKTVGTKLATKAATKALASGATKKAAADVAARVAARTAFAGSVAENVASNIMLAREEAFVANREATAETLGIAGAFGLIGPVFVGPALSAFSNTARKAAGKVDDLRTARAVAAKEAAEAKHIYSSVTSDIPYRDATKAARKAAADVARVESGDIPAAFTKSQQTELRRAVAAEKRAADNLAKREARLAALTPSDGLKATKVAERARDKAASEAAEHAAHVTKIRDSLAKRFGLETTEDVAVPRVPTAEPGPGDLESLLRASVSANKKPATNLAASEAAEHAAHVTKIRDSLAKGGLEAKGSSKSIAARTAVDDARVAFESAKASRLAAQGAADSALREAPDVARRAFDEAKERLIATESIAREKAKASFLWEEPKSAKFADLFTPGKRMSGAAEGLDEAASFLEWSRRAGVGLSYALESRTRRALGGGLGSALAGGVIGATTVAAGVGPMASGLVVRQMANLFRAASKSAADIAKNGGKSKLRSMPLAIGRAAYRARFVAAIHAITDELDENIHDPESFVNEVGAAYGDLEDHGPGVVAAVTRQQMTAISYLKGEAPSMPPKYPAMPQLGRREPTMQEMESYLRKVQAISDPMFIIQSMADGELHSDVVEAMDAVYPLHMLALREEVLGSLSEAMEPLTRKQAMSIDKLFGNRGAVHLPNNPNYQARTGLRAEADARAAESAPLRRKPGRPAGSPTISQQYRSHSQRASDSIGH